jgi:hypothetical protein
MGKKTIIVETVLKSNRKIVETGVKSIHLTQIYMTAQFPDIEQTL